MNQDTIAAISTGMTNSGIGIVRISGSEALEIADRVYKGKETITEVPTHTIHYGHVMDGDETVDEVLVMVMRGPRTFTGEDTVEINCHGGTYVVSRVLETVLKAGARPAEPGEFTKRAFLNGKMDLSQAEAVIDVITSENEYALQSSISQLKGSVKNRIKEIREKVGDGKVLLALSGGVDSSVAAGLLSRAIGKQLTCVFVDHGLLRKDEGDEVEGVFGPNGQFDLNFIRVNAQQRYYDKLAGVTEPEAKRKIIGEEFIRIFEEEAKKIGAVDFLAQGTIYPDVVESGLGGESAVIKSHHNVGGLPDFVDFKEIIEPLRDLFKDEVRKAGLELGIPERLVFRQPFPGPGLGIRIIGEVTAEKVRIVQDADFIYREEVDNAAAEYKKEHGEDPSWMPNQYFAALTNMRSVGVMGDFRTYDYAVALRAVKTIDFMTAESAEIPYAVLNKVMNRIINEVKGVNRVFYDLTSKPPGTIEFE